MHVHRPASSAPLESCTGSVIFLLFVYFFAFVFAFSGDIGQVLSNFDDVILNFEHSGYSGVP